VVRPLLRLLVVVVVVAAAAIILLLLLLKTVFNIAGLSNQNFTDGLV